MLIVSKQVKNKQHINSNEIYCIGVCSHEPNYVIKHYF